jgi:branched-chain amino acid transport system permease protein
VAEFAQLTADGLVSGLTYALMAVGLTLIFGIMHVVNFAHGEFLAIGGFTLYYLAVALGLNFFLAVLVAILVSMALGALVDALVLARMRQAHLTTSMLATIGLWFFIQNMDLYLFGSQPRVVPPAFGATPLRIGPISITGVRLFAGAVAIVLMVALHLFIRHSKAGKAMRATFQNRDVAALLGVNVNAVYRLTFTLGAALAGAAGALIGAIFLVYPAMGDQPALRAFTVVVMGGLGNFAGAIVSGLILGVVEAWGAVYLSADFKDAIAFAILVLVLVLRPSGLFGRRAAI